jgi:hypothetical protein
MRLSLVLWRVNNHQVVRSGMSRYYPGIEAISRVNDAQ